MGRVVLHIANANDTFTSEQVRLIEDGVQRAQDFVNRRFDFDYNVDLFVVAPSYLLQTIPEDGIGGRTYDSRQIVIVLDATQQPIRSEIVYETVCHELSHSVRWEKLPEYTRTLFDGMILEGLAVALEEVAVHDTEQADVQFFLREVQDTSEVTMQEILDVVGDDLNNESYEYDTLFYTGNDTLPCWAGYKLGYYLVKRYLDRTKTSIYDATTVSYAEFASVLK